jgi:uncharacterized metal-binding protein
VDTENDITTAKPPIVYSCSGCSDAGELADRIARNLSRCGVAEMSCIVGVGGRVKPLLNKALNAERILAIDGCPLNCVANTLRGAGVTEFEHLELQKLGFRKGSVPVTEESIQRGVEAATEIIAQQEPAIVS